MSNGPAWLGRLALFAAIAAAGLIIAAGPLYRFGGFDLTTAMTTLPTYGVYAAMATAVLAALWVVAALASRSGAGFVPLIVAVTIAATAAYFPVTHVLTQQALPKIHDVTTDTGNPPQWVALLEERKATSSGSAYNPANAAEQQKAYPEIQTFNSALPPAELFEKAKKVATDMGWAIAASEPAEGRIEATDTTLFFGLKEDVVIRVAADGTGSKLDIRSMSRQGAADAGSNASRIRNFLTRLKTA